MVGAQPRDTCHHFAERPGLAASDTHYPDCVRGYQRSGRPGFCCPSGSAGGNITGFTGLEYSPCRLNYSRPPTR
jgi:hypothetical protein